MEELGPGIFETRACGIVQGTWALALETLGSDSWLSLTSCVTSNQLLNFPESQSHHM